MPHSIFGWDLPPGCSINDIPGNRPEDGYWEELFLHFLDEKRIKERKFGIKVSDEETALITKLYNDPKYSSAIDAYLQMAIEFGIEVGEKQSEEALCENKYYEEQYLQQEFEKLRLSQDIIAKIFVIIGHLKGK